MRIIGSQEELDAALEEYRELSEKAAQALSSQDGAEYFRLGSAARNLEMPIAEYQQRRSGERVVIYTDAPAAYDYGYVVELGAPKYRFAMGAKRSLRRVSIPAASLEYQTGRYGSGMHAALNEDAFAEWRREGFAEPVEDGA